MSLTQKLVDTLLYEGKSRIGKKGRKRWSEQIVWDDQVPELGLKVSHTNRKTFVVSYRAGGRKRRKTLGTVAALSLAEARERALEVLGSVSEQAQAAATATPGREFRTVNELVEGWLERLRKKQGSCFVEQRMLRTHVQPAIGRSSPVEVSRAELGNLKRRVRRQFPSDGHRLAKVLDELFSWAEAQGAWARGRAARAALAAAGPAAGRTAAAGKPGDAASGGATPATAETTEPATDDAQPAAAAAAGQADDREQLTERLQEMSVLGAEMMAKLNEQAAARQRLEKELAALREELEEARRQPERSRLQEAERDAETLRGTVGQLMDRLKESKAEARELGGRLEDAESERMDLSRRLTAVAAERNALEDRLREAQGRAVAATRRLGSGGLGGRVALVGAGVVVGILLALLWPDGSGPAVAGAEAAGELEAAGRAAAAVPSSPAPVGRESAAVPPPAPAAEPPPAAAAPIGEAPAREAPAAPRRDDPDLSAVEPAVRAWAAAWQEQRAPDYLAAYSTSYEPPDGLSRRQWEARRRERIQAPAEIRLDLGALEVTRLGPGRVRIAFDQRYATESYRDQVRKVLELVWEEGGWKIAVERSE